MSKKYRMQWYGPLFTALALSACSHSLTTPAQNGTEGLTGTWELVSRTDRSASDSLLYEPTLGSDPIALLIYDAQGYMSVQIMKRQRGDSLASTLVQGSENNPGSFNGYDAYFGTYEADAATGQIIHRIRGTIDPKDIGKELRRNYTLTRDTLRLSFSTTNGNIPVRRTLTWVRAGKR